MKIFEKTQWEEMQNYCPKEYRNLVMKNSMDILIDGLKEYGGCSCI